MILCANPSAQFRSYRVEIEEAVQKVMSGHRYVLGEEVSKFEQEFASYNETKFAIGVANGTDALEIALRALEIGPGDEVITVSHTAVATVAAIDAVGASPVLVDVDPISYTLNSGQLEEVCSEKTKAVIPVHLYGHPANLDEIKEFCEARGLRLIEDASQAHGARWKGKRVGSIGHIGCFSCYPTKNLGAIGDAGLVTTNDERLNERIRMLREYGWRHRISHLRGRNSRLDELQAAVLRVKLRFLDEDNAKRNTLSEQYRNKLNNHSFGLPSVHGEASHVFHLFVIKTNKRDELLGHLKENNILAGVHYPVPVHEQPAFAGIVRCAGDMAVTEAIAGEVISLPIYPELNEVELQQVVDAANLFASN